MSYVVFRLEFNSLLRVVVVDCVDIDGIVDHHCLQILFIMY